MANKDIVVIGASAGGIEALRILVSDLPDGFKGSVFIVVHIAASGPNLLANILQSVSRMRVSNAQNGEKIQPGRIYVAPADHHLLLLKAGYIQLSRGPRENRARPAIDPLFRSAAHAFGPRVLGVILTGFLDDGTAGLWAVKQRGGTAIVQNPEEAAAPSMPMSALKHVEVDHCVKLREIAPLLVKLAGKAAAGNQTEPVTTAMETEVKIAKEENPLSSGILDWGMPSIYSCPECHGVLLQLKEGSNLRFRCHTGHAYSIQTLLSELNEQIEETVWNAIRAIEETALLMRRMGDQLAEHNHKEAAEALRAKAADAQARADQMRESIMKYDKPQMDRLAGPSQEEQDRTDSSR
jgi:two-component system chemotaxis response regulator CheB